MPDIPLAPPQWFYNDDNSNRPFLRVEFVERAPEDHPDPASFLPEFSFSVDIPLPKGATKNKIERPTPSNEPTPGQPEPEEPPNPEDLA